MENGSQKWTPRRQEGGPLKIPRPKRAPKIVVEIRCTFSWFLCPRMAPSERLFDFLGHFFPVGVEKLGAAQALSANTPTDPGNDNAF